MGYFQDMGVLLLYGMTALLWIKADRSFIFVLLCTVVLLCGEYFFERRLTKILGCVVFAGTSFFIPELVVFYSVMEYVLLKEKIWVAALTGVITGGILLTGNMQLQNGLPLHFAFGCLLAVLLERKTEKYDKLDMEFRKTIDEGEEKTLLLAEKNRALIEKQNYEIYAATLRERNRIAREIHDNVGHMLSRAILQMGALSTVYEEEPLHGQLLKVNDTLNLAMNNIRESVHDLHDDSVDLKQALLEATREMKQHYHLDLEYDMSQNVPRKVKYCFIAAVKEAMSNIVKYSNGDRIEIVLREHPALYQMTIEDNGTDEEKQKKATEQMREEKDDLKSAAGGMGLSNMRERVESLGGSIHVNCEKGFKIFISIRKKEEAV